MLLDETFPYFVRVGETVHYLDFMETIHVRSCVGGFEEGEQYQELCERRPLIRTNDEDTVES